MDIVDLVFPKFCLECGEKGKYLCPTCVAKVRLGGTIFNGFSIFKYEGVVRKAIIALKYKFAHSVSDELVEVSTLRLKKMGLPQKAILIPIPMFWHKENFRGFNQVGVMGERIAKEMGWDFNDDILIKKEETKAQVDLMGGERRENLKGSFGLNPSARLLKATYIIFDDVYTTGSTLKEAGGLLQLYRKRTVNLTISG